MEDISPDTIKSDYRIERLDAGRLSDLDTLYRAVYGIKREKGYFRAKYDTVATGAEYTGCIAYNKENIPVAYYGVMPCFIQYNGEIILSAQSGDTMTHPQYRHKGLFVELSKITFQLCREAGVKLIFGFPNQNSYPAMVNILGWKMTENMERFIIPVMPSAFGVLAGRYKKYTQRLLSKYLLPQRGLANAAVAEGYAGVLRDDRYFRYKTYSPTQVIKAGTAIAWIKIGKGLVIGDMEAAEHNFDEAIELITKIARRAGVSQVSFHTSPGTRLHALFAARYKPAHSFAVLLQDLGAGIPLDKFKFTFSDIDIF